MHSFLADVAELLLRCNMLSVTLNPCTAQAATTQRTLTFGNFQTSEPQREGITKPIQICLKGLETKLKFPQQKQSTGNLHSESLDMLKAITEMPW